jgi:cell division protein FtsZ
LLLDTDDVLTTSVTPAPIAPPVDEIEEVEAETDETSAAPVRESGTLFERMSNIARGAAKAQVDDEDSTPGFRREPIDIPRFLNRQNNQ